MDVKRLDAMDVYGKNHVMYDCSCFERDIGSGARNRRWAVLSWWRVGILVDSHSAKMPFARCEQKLSYCPLLWGAIDAKMEVADGDSELQCWFFDKPQANMYLKRGGTHGK